MLDVNEYKSYISLHKQKKEVEEELESVKKLIAEYERRLIDNLISNDMNKLSVDGRTIYINSTIWAKVSDKEKAIEALTKEGYGDYIKPSYNSQQISRLLRDLEENEQPIPASFVGIIDPVIKQTLNVIKSN